MKRFNLILWLLISAGLSAQDIHFSQAPFFGSAMSPSLLNAFNGQIRINAIYRGQWITVPVNYQSAGINADFELYELPSQKLRIGAGMILTYDVAGTSRMNNLQTSVQLAAEYRLGKENKHAIGAGAGLGFLQMGFDPSRLRYDNQYNGDAFDPNRQSGEQFLASNRIKPDFSAGFHYRFIRNNRHQLQLALGFRHLNKPVINFNEGAADPLGIRYDLHFRYQIQLSTALDIIPDFFASFHTADNGRLSLSEQSFGAVLRIHSVKRKGPDFWDAGVYTRFNPISKGLTSAKPADALWFIAGLQWGPWTSHLSYDINISTFSNPTRSFGAIEITAGWVFARVKKIKDKGVSCPLF
jgi:type IX secretion system PorP/SprF family membrane protein